MKRCCRPYGYRRPGEEQVLAWLAESGVLDRPATEVQVWAGRPGWAWRLVDGHGQDLEVTSRRTCRDLAALLAGPGLAVVDDGDGGLAVVALAG